MKKELMTVPFLAIAGRSLGMLIPFCIARVFGAERFTDVFFWVFSLMTFVISMMIYLFESVLVPYLAEQHIRSATAADFAFILDTHSVSCFQYLGGSIQRTFIYP